MKIIGSNGLNIPVPGLGLGGLFSAGAEASLKACRRRKARTVFSDHQLTGLEKRFNAQRYLSTPERVELANALHLTETQVGAVTFGIIHSFNVRNIR